MTVRSWPVVRCHDLGVDVILDHEHIRRFHAFASRVPRVAGGWQGYAGPSAPAACSAKNR
jgi:hypothetical protein